MVDQRRCTGSKMLRHSFARKLIVVFLQRGKHPAMVSNRLVGPAGDGGKHCFRRIPGDLRHQLSELGGISRNVDGPVEVVIETDRSLVVAAGIGVLELSLDLSELAQLVVADADHGARGELAADMCLYVGDVSEISPRHRQHHEAATRLLSK